MLGWFKKKIRQLKEEPAAATLSPSDAVAVPIPPESIPTDRPDGESAAGTRESAGATGEIAGVVPSETEVSPAVAIAPESVPTPTATDVGDAAPVVTATGTEEPPPVENKREGLFQRLANKLAKTRDSFVKKIDKVFLGKKEIDAQLLDELEETLITADLGVHTVHALLDGVREKVRRKELSDPAVLRQALKDRILEYLLAVDQPAELSSPDGGPIVMMVLGVNGVGKTTTIGKIAYKFVNAGNKVLLVAADTFRAAAVEQLKIWGARIGVEVVSQKQGADPSSVIYDALDYARPRDFDVIIVDTAGRLHTKVNLMEELKKIKRVMDKKHPGAPHEVLLVLDATTGQNAVLQAKMFHEAVNITGIALTKLDGTAKGGIIVNICHELNIPIRFIGIGEQLDDLRDFDPREFVEALFAETAQEE